MYMSISTQKILAGKNTFPKKNGKNVHLPKDLLHNSLTMS